MVSAEDVLQIVDRLSVAGIWAWICGGWGIDALLGCVTRPHKDIDLLVLLDDIARARVLLERDGYALRDLWSENLSAIDAQGVETPTAFVLRDPAGREVDLHAMRLDGEGNGIPAYDGSGMVFGREDLAGKGTVSGTAVDCISVSMQLRCHTGYTLPEMQVQDLRLLREWHGARLPDGKRRTMP